MENKIIAFLSEIEKNKSTLRHNWTRSGRQESVAEHSWRSAVFLGILHDLYDLDVDIEKAFKMMLVHDIPELVDGDVPAFSKKRSIKKQNELLNAKKVFSMLPAPLDKQYFELFKEFEEGKTPESKLLQAIEKIESNLQHLDSGPKFWTEEERGPHMLNYPNNALKKIKSKELNKIWGLIRNEIEKIT